MPTYQYACTECGEQLEVVQKFSDEPLTVCPACQGRLRKVFSAVGVVFKGSGFYKTDSRSGSSSSAGRSESKTDGKDGAKTDGKTEKKADSTSVGSSGGESKPAASGGSDGSKVA